MRRQFQGPSIVTLPRCHNLDNNCEDMVGPPCWLTSYLRLTSLHPEVELSRTSHYHQRIISRHRKTSKNILRKSTFVLKKTPTWPWNCRILECIRVLASAFTWSHHVLQVYQIRSTTSTHASKNGDIFWWRRSSTCNILMVISTASAPKDNNILFGGIPGPPTVESEGL